MALTELDQLFGGDATIDGHSGCRTATHHIDQLVGIALLIVGSFDHDIGPLGATIEAVVLTDFDARSGRGVLLTVALDDLAELGHPATAGRPLANVDK